MKKSETTSTCSMSSVAIAERYHICRLCPARLNRVGRWYEMPVKLVNDLNDFPSEVPVSQCRLVPIHSENCVINDENKPAAARVWRRYPSEFNQPAVANEDEKQR